jgi:hypothetical protein
MQALKNKKPNFPIAGFLYDTYLTNILIIRIATREKFDKIIYLLPSSAR